MAVCGNFGFVLNDRRVALFLGYEWFIFPLPKIKEKKLSLIPVLGVWVSVKFELNIDRSLI